MCYIFNTIVIKCIIVAENALIFHFRTLSYAINTSFLDTIFNRIKTAQILNNAL